MKITGCLILCAVAASVGAARPLQNPAGGQDHTAWLLERIKEATAIKTGRSRADLLKISVPERGFQLVPLRAPRPRTVAARRIRLPRAAPGATANNTTQKGLVTGVAAGTVTVTVEFAW